MDEEKNIREENSAELITNSNEEVANENILQGQAIEQTETINQTSDITTSDILNMEVHHHPHVEKKNFKEYLLEGLMIFIAVTLGFFAEGIRENITDNAKENEYIQSMIEDAETDTANIHAAIKLNEKRVTSLDTLARYCFNYNGTQAEEKIIYRTYRKGLVHPDLVSPTARTMLQLKNSGGMRLIGKKAAVDSIIAYDDMAKKLADQLATYERYQNESVNSSFALFNFKYYQENIGGFSKHTVHDYDSATLINADQKKLIEFGNRIFIYKGVVAFYNIRLQAMETHAIGLINTLKEEYNLKDE